MMLVQDATAEESDAYSDTTQAEPEAETEEVLTAVRTLVARVVWVTVDVSMELVWTAVDAD